MQMLIATTLESLRLGFEYELPAAAEVVWETMTARMSDWWRRAAFFCRPDSLAMHIEPFAGGRIWEEYANGGSILWWTITEFDPAKLLSLEGHHRNEPNGPLTDRVHLEFTSTGNGETCTLQLTHVLVGQFSDPLATRAVFTEGWNTLFDQGLRSMLQDAARQNRAM
jgi:uncharacterized protein YndB with AHSA1/START domain